MGATVGIVGSGNIGKAVARLAAEAQIDVLLSKFRGAGSLRDLVSELGVRVRGVDVAEATSADVVVAAIPLPGLQSLGAVLPEGRVLIDVSNYHPALVGELESLEGSVMPSSVLVQQWLPTVNVVKALN